MPWAWAAQCSVKNPDTPAGSRARLGPGPGDLPAAQPVFCVLFQGGEIEPMGVEAAARVSAFGMARRAGVRRSRARGLPFPMLCQAIAAPARAQLAENNAVTAAEDAFGSSVGGPCVGLAAQAYSLPSPAAIADLRLHVPDEATSLSTSTYGGAYGQAGVLVEGKAPVPEHVSGGLCASFYSNARVTPSRTSRVVTLNDHHWLAPLTAPGAGACCESRLGAHPWRLRLEGLDLTNSRPAPLEPRPRHARARPPVPRHVRDGYLGHEHRTVQLVKSSRPPTTTSMSASSFRVIACGI